MLVFAAQHSWGCTRLSPGRAQPSRTGSDPSLKLARLARRRALQPNSRLLINYGIVDENNPYDKLLLTGGGGSARSGLWLRKVPSVIRSKLLP
jgi:hypothetical protein